jgi:hypothetical protein
MCRSASAIRASIIIAAIAIALVGAISPTNRSVPSEQVRLVGSYGPRTSHRALDDMGGSADKREMCWYDPDVPRCE